MIRICLVGEIASGKTYVANCFGYPIFNADKEVIKIYKKNRKCFNQLKKKFPKNINYFPIKKSQTKKSIKGKRIKKEKNSNIQNTDSTTECPLRDVNQQPWLRAFFSS